MALKRFPIDFLALTPSRALKLFADANGSNNGTITVADVIGQITQGDLTALGVTLNADLSTYQTALQVTAAISSALTGYASTTALANEASARQTAISALAPVARSGAYADLTGSPALKAVATSGVYSDLTGAPTLGNIVPLTGTAQGQIAYYGTTGWAVLAPGISGRLLQTNGASANPSWVDPPAGTGGSGTITGVNPGSGLSGGGVSGSVTLAVSFGTTTGTVAAGDDSRIVNALQRAGNLNDLTNLVTARTNLGLATVASTGNYSDLSGKPTLGAAASLDVGQGVGTVAAGNDSRLLSAEQSANKGQINGYAGLDGAGKVPTTQLPASVVGSLNYQGGWNAGANSPGLASGSGTKGMFYTVTTAGSTALDGISQWNVGDHAAFNGLTWEKIDGVASEVISVFGRTGAVAMIGSDVTAALGYTPYSAANPSGYLTASNNLSDIGSQFTARSNLGLVTVANTGNYNDLTSKPTLGTAAAKAASGAGGTVASVTGAFTAGHVAVFSDTAGTIQDGGAPGGSSTVPVTTVATSGATQTIAFPASGNAAYDVTLSANCTVSITGGTAGQMQALTVQLRAGTGGFTPSFPAGVIWKGGAAPGALASGQIILVQLRSLDAATTIVGEF